MAGLISYGVTKQYDPLVYHIVLTQGIYVFIMIFMRPFRRAFDNVTMIILEFTTFYALALPLSMYYVEVDELDEIFLIFILQGLLLISLGLNLTRILVYYINIVRVYHDPTVTQLMVENSAKAK